MRNNIQNKILMLCACPWFLLSCNHDSASIEDQAEFNATLWLQTAAEYHANAIQAYRSATNMLDEAIADTSWTAALEQSSDFSDLPAAIILDIDETVLSNSPYYSQLMLTETSFTTDSFTQWIELAKDEALAGAVDFLNHASAQGVTIFFVSNRECTAGDNSTETCPQLQASLDNLQNLGVNDLSADQILLEGGQADWTSEKQSRREYIAENYRILMLFGDNLSDFIANVDTNISIEARYSLINEYQDYWGERWFILPNPLYGSWLDILEEPLAQYLTADE